MSISDRSDKESNIDLKLDESRSDFIDHNRLSLIPIIFNDKQMERYAAYQSSSIENRKRQRGPNKIDNPRTKKIIQSVLGENVYVSDPVNVIMHAIAKIHAGELVEEAKKVLYLELEQENIKDGKPRPIKPRHLREARRRMLQNGSVPSFKPQDPLND